MLFCTVVIRHCVVPSLLALSAACRSDCSLHRFLLCGCAGAGTVGNNPARRRQPCWLASVAAARPETAGPAAASRATAGQPSPVAASSHHCSDNSVCRHTVSSAQLILSIDIAASGWAGLAGPRLAGGLGWLAARAGAARLPRCCCCWPHSPASATADQSSSQPCRSTQPPPPSTQIQKSTAAHFLGLNHPKCLVASRRFKIVFQLMQLYVL